MEITIRTGVMELKPIEYRLEEGTVRAWFRTKTIYYISTDFCRLGPFEDKAEAQHYLVMARRS